MDVDHEIKRYLRLLLDHANQCEREGCTSHAMLHEICGIVRQRIFTGPAISERDGGSPLQRVPGDLKDLRTGAAGVKY